VTETCAAAELPRRDSEKAVRALPLHLRKTSLQRLLARRPEGIFVNPFERGEIGPDLFRSACRMGLEGLVSKHPERPYQSRQIEALGEGQEPEASCDVPRDGRAGVMPAAVARAKRVRLRPSRINLRVGYQA